MDTRLVPIPSIRINPAHMLLTYLVNFYFNYICHLFLGLPIFPFSFPTRVPHVTRCVHSFVRRTSNHSPKYPVRECLQFMVFPQREVSSKNYEILVRIARFPTKNAIFWDKTQKYYPLHIRLGDSLYINLN